MSIKGFISYSHNDEDYFNFLKKEVVLHNPALEYMQWEIWTDTQINLGENWHNKIVEARNTCNFAFLFVSPDFLRSAYIANIEAPFFLEKAKNDASFHVLPILVRAINLSQFKGNELLFFNPVGKEFKSDTKGIFPYSKLFLKNNNGELFIKDQSLADEYHLQLAKKIELSISKRIEINKSKNSLNKNPTTITTAMIEEFKMYGIDIGILAEIKKQVIHDIKVEIMEHNCIISGKDIRHEVTITGINNSENEIQFIPFTSGGVIPSTYEDMHIQGYDIKRGEKLGIFSEENEQNSIKEIKVFFKEPIKNNESFSIKCGFTLKDTMLINKKDFIVSSTSFAEDLKKYKLTLEFKDHRPNSIRLLVLNNKKVERVLVEDENKVFNFEIDESNANYLNQMRVLLLFERK